MQSVPAAPEGALRAGAMRMLAALASFHPKSVTKNQIAALVGMSVNGGTFNTYLGELKRKDWLRQTGEVCTITPEGMEAAGDITPVSKNPEDILQLWMGKFRLGAAKILKEIASAYPKELNRDDLADRLQMTATGGTFNTYLGELRRNGLVEVRGPMVKASTELFPE